MRRAGRLVFLLLATAAMLAAPALAAEGVADAALVAAARKARLSDIDQQAGACGDKRGVDQWLRDVAGRTARSIRWAGGKCTLVDPQNPRDAGTRWCAHADITPKTGNRGATIEVFFERPRNGKPGKAFAFRSFTKLKDDANYARSTGEFASDWRQTHVRDYKPGEADSCSD